MSDKKSSNTCPSGKGSSSSQSYPYTVNSSGTNSRGNSYDNRNQPGGSAYHYSNSDGSYYYKNSNDSTYHNTGSGQASVETYTAPDGTVYKR